MSKSETEIKVMHIIAGNLNGGAARGAYLLHLGLLKKGIHSSVLSNSSSNNYDNKLSSIANSTQGKIKNALRQQLDVAPTLFYPSRKNQIFSTGFFSGFDFTKTSTYTAATIIHLHWINDGFVNIRHLQKVKKPIVWTLRDMWPMTGGCHYSMDCNNYTDNCGNCPQLNSKSKIDLSSIVIASKKKFIPPSTKIIGISNWISELAKKSSLFKEFDVRTISNNIDTDEFFPIQKEIARSILGISTNKKIILIGAHSISDFYKGFNKFIDALGFLNINDYHLCFFGNINPELLNKLGFSFSSFGFLNDTVALRLTYSAADVFVAPSIMDAFGKTLVEAMACETPVVCFNATGPKDIVDHMVNGYCAIPFIPEDIADGIKWICNNPNIDELSKSARKKAVAYFDVNIISEKYIDIYKEISNYDKSYLA